MNNRTHMDLLRQVADSEAEDREVRRALSAPALRACSRCESGMARCVTPEACERAEDASPAPRAEDMVRVAAIFLAVWAAVVFALVATGVSL